MTRPFRGGVSLRAIVAPLAFVLAGAVSCFAQNTGAGPTSIAPQNPGFTMGVQESDSTIFSEDSTGSTVINPNADRRQAFSTVSVRGREYAQASTSTSAEFDTGIKLRPLFGLNEGLKRLRGPAPPPNALQAGPFYLKFNELTGALLVSDNVNFVPNNAHWGAIAELRLRLTAILQISPGWRLAVSGNIIYLPFANKVGIEGLGIGDAVGFLAEESIRPLTHMQLAYNSEWADWTVQAADDFSVNYLSIGGDFDLAVRGVAQPENVHAEDAAGRYVFANGTTIPDQGLRQRQGDFLDVRTFLALKNTVAGSASRLVPTETRLTFGASHSDFWFQGSTTDNGTNGLGFSNYSVDRVYASLRNERESMRFKPFAYYDAYRYNYDTNWTHQAAGGVAGPVTENLFFHGEVGYTWSDASLSDTLFYHLRLVQTPGPYTKQYLSYSRVLTEPVREIRDTYRYGIFQVLGPDLLGRLSVERSVYQPGQAGVYSSVEDRAAARIIWEPSKRFNALIGAFYAESRFANPTRDRETMWEARAQVRYTLEPGLSLSLYYRYLNVDTRSRLLQTITAENLWILSLTKIF
jgi:hypothetical protein